MPTVVFEVRGKEPKVVQAPLGGSLVDVCDTTQAPIEFSCRSADCGTCLITVLEGEEALLPAGPDERAVLETLRAPPGRRLACQTRMRPGEAHIRIAPTL
jgi:2Fe-2S ferredoxin